MEENDRCRSGVYLKGNGGGEAAYEEGHYKVRLRALEIARASPRQHE